MTEMDDHYRQIEQGRGWFEEECRRVAKGFAMRDLEDFGWARPQLDGSPPDPWNVRMGVAGEDVLFTLGIDRLADCGAGDLDAQDLVRREIMRKLRSEASLRRI